MFFFLDFNFDDTGFKNKIFHHNLWNLEKIKNSQTTPGPAPSDPDLFPTETGTGPYRQSVPVHIDSLMACLAPVPTDARNAVMIKR